MKKIFTLLCAVGLLTVAANAQQGSRDSRSNPQYDQRNPTQYGQRTSPQYDPRNDQQNGQWDRNYGYNNGRDNDDRFDRGGRYMEMQIAQINRKYEFQVQRVRNDFFMRRYEKMRTLRYLEVQRQEEIRMVYAQSRHNRGWKEVRGYSNQRY